jgi:cytoplasmic iron level regulating protein YaaA (DUF328/UPF0246 family)
MIKILFSPAEGKNNGGNEIAREVLGSNNARKNIFDEYSKIIDSKNEEDIKKLFGLKKFDDCIPYINNIYNSKLMCAIERYQGVAYEYLDLKSLNSKELEYLKQNTIIFSNLYGPILGGDTIINYKVKQGNNVGDITPDKFYKDRFTYQLNLYLAKDEILDLRAGYYDKFYKVTTPYVTLKFLKNGKTVSHWAKAYRGLVLRALAKNNISSLEEFKSLEIDNLSVNEIKIIKNKTEIVYNIL